MAQRRRKARARARKEGEIATLISPCPLSPEALFAPTWPLLSVYPFDCADPLASQDRHVTPPACPPLIPILLSLFHSLRDRVCLCQLRLRLVHLPADPDSPRRLLVWASAPPKIPAFP